MRPRADWQIVDRYLGLAAFQGDFAYATARCICKGSRCLRSKERHWIVRCGPEAVGFADCVTHETLAERGEISAEQQLGTLRSWRRRSIVKLGPFNRFLHWR